MITDGAESYALFIYQCGAVSWHGNATVGFNAGGTWFENHPFSGTRNVASVSCLNSTTSVWTNLVYKLTPDGKLLIPTTYIYDRVSYFIVPSWLSVTFSWSSV